MSGERRCRRARVDGVVSELGQVLDAISAEAGRGAALATVVGVRGSAYRREGARLVVPVSGEPVGNVSAGCLEEQIVDHARDVVVTGRCRVLRFDLGADDDLWGWGLGCNGVVEVLVEPVEQMVPVAEALRRARSQGRPASVVTVLDGDGVGDRVLVHAGGSVEGSLGEPALDRRARDLAVAAMAAGHSYTATVEGAGRVLVEVVEPPIHLVVCGAGPDAVPLVEFAARLGWKVAVVDHRRERLTAAGFPGAHLLAPVEPARAAAAVGAGARTCVVVMSHDLGRDREYLRSFLDGPCAYLGVLGPAARLEALLDGLRAEGVVPSPATPTRIHGPAGLDLGAESPDEVACAIVAEVLAVRRGAGAGHLRERKGPVHPRPSDR
jgi:xanthine dehydrogenase accessory factor